MPFTFQKGRINCKVNGRARLVVEDKVAANKRGNVLRTHVDASMKVGARNSECPHERVFNPSAPNLVFFVIQERTHIYQSVELQTMR